MKKRIKIKPKTKQILADTITPVSVFLKVRDIFPNSVLLESSDYHGNKDSYSFICLEPVATFLVENNQVKEHFPKEESQNIPIKQDTSVPDLLHRFIQRFEVSPFEKKVPVNGIFGYTSYDAVQYFEDVSIQSPEGQKHAIPAMYYSLYKYIIAINHFQNNLHIIENVFEGETSQIGRIEDLLHNRNLATYPFHSSNHEVSNLTDEQYKEMVSRGKEHCRRGDVFQIVLSRQFSQHYTGDDFNVYRALRSINPSPYLFYFDYGSFRLFGSSPETQLQIQSDKAYIHPIAGTFKRTGDDEKDKQLAEQLAADQKENSEHVMLVDLARNDLSRNAGNVKVETYKEIQFYSHVIHMVSEVSGKLPENTNPIQVMGDSFPAGTLSGAPKVKAMQLIDHYENQNRGYYGGCIGNIGFNGDFNHAIMIRSFLSKNNTLFYQAGAGIVVDSKEEKELTEVNNKLAALKKAILSAQNI